MAHENITLNPASLFLDDNETVLVSQASLQIDPKCFQQVATEF